MTEDMQPTEESIKQPAPDQRIPVPPSQEIVDAQAGVQSQKPSDTTPLVLGILSIIFVGLIGLVLGIVGLVTSKKALEATPESGKAKGGRICSIIGLVLSVLALIATIALVVTGASIIGTLTGEEGAIRQTAETTLEESFKPSEDKRVLTVRNFDQAFEASAGISFSQLGISSTDFANWLYDDASYKISKVNMSFSDGNESATVLVSVTTRSLADLEENIGLLANSIDESTYATATTEAEVYKIIGDVVREAMEQTPLTTKTLPLKVVKQGDTWQVDKQEAANFVIEAFTAQ